MMIYFFLLAQVIFESLPISSSAHTILLTQFSTINIPKSLDLFMHAPTVIMLLFYFYTEWSYVLLHYKNYQKRIFYWASLVFIANCLTVLCAVIVHVVDIRLFPLSLGLGITAVSLLSLRYIPKFPESLINTQQACIIGVVQGIALLPGISRLGLTYSIGRWLGLSSYSAFRFSCALQITLFTAGSFLGFIQSLKEPLLWEILNYNFLLLTIGACIIAYMLLAFVERCMRTNTLWYFGIYMILPTLLALFS